MGMVMQVCVQNQAGVGQTYIMLLDMGSYSVWTLSWMALLLMPEQILPLDGPSGIWAVGHARWTAAQCF